MIKHLCVVPILCMGLFMGVSCSPLIISPESGTLISEQSPIACSDIPISKLSDVFSKNGSMDEAIRWVQATFDQTPQVKESTSRFLYWTYGRNQYAVNYDRQGNPYKATVWLDQAPTPTIQEVLGCFGVPELYRVYRELSDQKYLAVDLLYPSTGFSFLGYGSNGRTIPASVEGWIPVSSISYVAPGTDQHMIHNLYHDRISNDADFQKFFILYRSWPGSLEAMEIEGE